MKLIMPAALILFVGLIAGTIIAPNYLEWQKHTSFLEKHIAQLAGVPKAKITGEVKIKTLPTPSLSIEHLEFAAFHGEKPLATIENFTTELSWQSLWQLSVKPQYVRTDAININLIKNQDGEANYLPKRHSRRISSNAPSSLYPLGAFGDVSLKDVTLNLENKSAGTTQRLTTDEIQLSSPSLLQTAVNIDGKLNNALFSIKGDINLKSLRQVPLDIKLILAKNQFNLEGTAFDPFYKPMYTGHVRTQISELSDPFHTLGIDVPDFIQKSKNLKNILFQGHIMVNDNEVAVRKMDLKMNVPNNGKNTKREVIKGRIFYNKSQRQKPAHLDLKLEGQDLNLEQLFSAIEQDEPKSQGWSDVPFDLSILGQFTFNARFKGQNITYADNIYDRLTLQIMNTNSTLTLENLTVADAGGKAKLSGNYQHANSTPGLKAKIRFQKLPLNSLPANRISKTVSGKTTGMFDLTSRGISEKDLINHLNGTGEIHITDGTLHGMKLEDTVTAARKIFNKNESDEHTDFSNMSLSFKIKDGTISNEDFYLHTEKAALKAKGKVDLVNQKINLRVRPQLETDLLDLLVPIHISGSLSAPNISPVVTNSTGKGAALGAVLGGPIGAGIGALIGSKVNKDNKQPEEQTNPLTPQEIKNLEEKVKKGIENPLPFELENVTPDDVRQYLDEE